MMSAGILPQHKGWELYVHVAHEQLRPAPWEIDEVRYAQLIPGYGYESARHVHDRVTHPHKPMIVNEFTGTVPELYNNEDSIEALTFDFVNLGHWPYCVNHTSWNELLHRQGWTDHEHLRCRLQEDYPDYLELNSYL
jgi:hypothetical protein